MRRGRWIALALAAALLGALAIERTLAQARGEVVGLGVWDEALPLLSAQAAKEGVAFRGYPIGALDRPDLAQLVGGAKLVLVLNGPGERTQAYLEKLRELRKGGAQLVALDARDWQGPLLSSQELLADAEVQRYWRYTGAENFQRLFGYLAVRYLHAHRRVLPPAPALEDGLYHPDAPAPFASLADYQSWEKSRHRAAGAPRAAYFIYSNWVTLKQTADIDAIMHALEQRGFEVVALFSSNEPWLRQTLVDLHPDLLLTHNHSQLGKPADGSQPIPELLGVPYLKPTIAMQSTYEEWLARPEGLTAYELGRQIFINELEGTIEPVLVSTQQTEGEARITVPVAERVERFADRAKAWVDLQRTPETDKRLAVIYYDVDLSGESLAQGSASGMFLNGPESLVRFARALQERGYAVAPPADAASLLARLARQGRNYGPWAQAQIDDEARSGAVLVSLADYRRWFETKLTPQMQARVIESHGPPPGHLMVTAIHGAPEIVIPRVELGPGVSLFPQPEKGARQDSRLVHDQTAPPSHQYLAFYFWLQEVYRPHALVHFGTHGTLELLPHRGAGLGPDDYADALLGRTPNLNPWTIENLGEATLARRRAYATLIDHLTPSLEAVRSQGPLRALREDVSRAGEMEDGPVREAFRRRIAEQMRAQAFGLDLLPAAAGGLPDAAAMKELALRLEALEEEHVPKSLHVLGQAPAADERAAFVETMLGGEFEKRAGGREKGLAAITCALANRAPAGGCLPGGLPSAESAAALGRDLDAARKLDADLQRAPDEMKNLLGALDGRYVPPGPGGDPARNPAALPTGRNLYALDPEQVPSGPAMEVAQTLVEQTLAAFRAAHAGRAPKKLAINLNGFETMHDTGVSEAEALVLLGVEPVRDARGLVTEVRRVPREKLGRPRVDVLLAISGMYRDNFPSRIRLLDRAMKLAQAAPEADNPLAADVAEEAAALRSAGLSPQESQRRARRRIFGDPAGHYGTQILYLIPRSGAWTDRAEIARVYEENMRFAYGEDVWGEEDAQGYAQALRGTEAVLHTWSSSVMSPLTNHHVYEYLGGLSLAVEANGGARPDALVLDARDAAHPRSRALSEVLSTEEATRLLNPDWIRRMEKEGYAGAGHVSAYAENLFGWATTVPDAVAGRTFERIDELYRRDTGKLGTRRWMEESNPEALQGLTATLLEGARRGYWKPDAALLKSLVRDHLEQVVARGVPTGLMGGGNEQLAAFVRKVYEGPGAAIPRATLQAYEARLAQASAGQRDAARAVAAGLARLPAARPVIEGTAMRPAPGADARDPARAASGATAGRLAALSAAVIALAFALSLWRQQARRRPGPW